MIKNNSIPVLLILLLMQVSSCSGKTTKETVIPKLTYEDFLKEVKAEKAKLKNQSNAEAKKYLFQLIHNKIPEYWVGTLWDFNGVTRKPKEGKIACGYFITNTLADLGFPIERVKLAQAASSELIKAMTVNIKRTGNFQVLKDYIQEQTDENAIFIVGLDFHCGYITKEKTKMYFIHSNYINKQGVVKELIDQSEALKSSKTFMIGNITANDEMIEKWLNQE